MFSKVYNLRFTSLSEAKIALSFLTENIGGCIATDNIASLNIFLDKEGCIAITVRFDTLAELSNFEKKRGELLSDLRKSFTVKLDHMSAVAVFTFEREATLTQ